MIGYEQFQLENGLRVVVHQDKSTPMAVMNLLYDVGARNEAPEKTGFAHLFEHLMFEGSENAPNFDEPMERAGGQNNAFTNNDLTNYYEIIPAVNLETAFWLESDRMRSLRIEEETLSVQQKVVVEEFKENYINQPYGLAWHELRDLAYQVHPYRWPTIGKKLAHITEITLEDVRSFYDRYYHPNNAILVVAGNVSLDLVRELSEKWFGDIPSGLNGKPELPAEPLQKEKREKHVEADVPLDAIYMTFHMARRQDPDYYAADLTSDILASGKSSRFFKRLVKEKELFSTIDAYITGNIDEGLLVIEGRLNLGRSIEEGERAIWEELRSIQTGLHDEELVKVKNKVESGHEFGDVNLMNRAFNLAFASLMEDIKMVNDEVARYRRIEKESIHKVAEKLFRPENCSVLYYNRLKN